MPAALETTLFNGGYPALYDHKLSADDWFPNYVATYLERDVRQLLAVKDLTVFQRFVKMCAARSGHLLNLTALGADCGVSATTARDWLSVLEASYLVFRLPPYHRNLGKRLVKTPKLYFLDTGLMAWLLGIRDAETLSTHAARGAVFETFVVSELIKQRFNAGRPADLSFWRDNVGLKVDLLDETPAGLQAIEVKSGCTVASDWTHALRKWRHLAGDEALTPILVYGGDDTVERNEYRLMRWRSMSMP